MEWWNRILRIAEFSVPAWSDRVVDEAVRTARDLGFDVQHLAPMETRGGERGVLYFPSRTAETAPQDYLGPYLEAARRAGIRVIASINLTWFESAFAARHRDWMQHRSDGTLIGDVQGKGSCGCTNSPGFRGWALQLIRDLARQGVDGLFLDGPTFLPGGCWCAACRARFRDRVRKDLPARENWEDAAWKEFIEFRYESVTELVRDARAALRKIRPEAAFYVRGQGPEPGWPSGRDNRRLAPYQDLIAARAGRAGADAMGGGLWRRSLTARLLSAQAAGRPTALAVCGEDGGWEHTSPGPVETRLAYAQAIAHGASPWYGAAYETSGDASARAAAEMNGFIKATARYLEGTTSVADIAVLWSARTTDYYRATVAVTEHGTVGERHTRKHRPGTHERAAAGWCDCLIRNHLQFDLLDEQDLEGSIERYRVLILPNVACISHNHASAITAWVESGGALVSTFETSSYTDWGVRRSTPALRDVLGVEPVGVVGPTELDYFDRAEDPLFDAVTARLLPAPRYRCIVNTVGECARAVTYYRERMPTRHHPLTPPSSHPAVVENQRGRGSSLHFTGTIDEAYLDHHAPDHGALMCARPRQATRACVAVQAPSSVEIVVRQQRSRRRLLVHLINGTGEMCWPVNRVVEIERVSIAFPHVTKASGASCHVPGESAPRVLPLKSRRKGGVEVVVPRLGPYALVVLEGVT
jgi:hypothetical protein